MYLVPDIKYVRSALCTCAYNPYQQWTKLHRAVTLPIYTARRSTLINEQHPLRGCRVRSQSRYDRAKLGARNACVRSTGYSSSKLDQADMVPFSTTRHQTSCTNGRDLQSRDSYPNRGKLQTIHDERHNVSTGQECEIGPLPLKKTRRFLRSGSGRRQSIVLLRSSRRLAAVLELNSRTGGDNLPACPPV